MSKEKGVNLADPSFVSVDEYLTGNQDAFDMTKLLLVVLLTKFHTVEMLHPVLRTLFSAWVAKG
jgi:hypothetical protein